jgi:hypothetical protein
MRALCNGCGRVVARRSRVVTPAWSLQAPWSNRNGLARLTAPPPPDQWPGAATHRHPSTKALLPFGVEPARLRRLARAGTRPGPSCASPAPAAPRPATAHTAPHSASSCLDSCWPDDEHMTHIPRQGLAQLAPPRHLCSLECLRRPASPVPAAGPAGPAGPRATGSAGSTGPGPPGPPGLPAFLPPSESHPQGRGGGCLAPGRAPLAGGPDPRRLNRHRLRLRSTPLTVKADSRRR